jgi:hypothetical protein
MVIAIVCALPLACGGGGGDFVPPEALSVTFVPDDPNPGAMTISMGQATVVGESFQVPIVVTGIDNFFGAGFHVNFDPASAQFIGYVHEDEADYFIEEAGVTVLINAVSGGDGVVLVGATRQQGATYVPGVAPTAPDNILILLNFRASGATAGNAFTFSDQEVNTCDDASETCPVIDPATMTTPWPGGTMVAN